METLLVSDAVKILAESGRHVVPATVRSWVDSGQLRATRSLRGVRLILRADLDLFIRERTTRKSAA